MGGWGSDIPEKTKNCKLVCDVTFDSNDNLVDNNKLYTSSDTIYPDNSILLSQSIQNGVQEFTPKCVNYDYYTLGPGFENYPQASESNITDGVLEYSLRVDVQPVTEIHNSEYEMRCDASETVFFDGDWYAPGFECYPQEPEYELHGGPHGNILINDKLFTRVLQSNVEMQMQPVIKVLDIEYVHSYTAVVCSVDEHGGLYGNPSLDASNQGGPTANCTLQVTNFTSFYGGTRVPVVHVQGKNCSNLFGFYLWIQDPWGGGSALIPHAHPPEGLFNIIGMICLHVVPVCPAKWGGTSGQFLDPGLMYDNYCKDNRSWQYYDCSYEDYMLTIIDTMIDAVEQPPSERDPLGSEPEGLSGIKQSCLNQSSDMVVPNSKHMCDDFSLALQSRGQVFDDASSQNRDTPSLIRDFNYPNKTVGYLAQESTDFEFIGLDRHPVAITTLLQLLEIADIIRSTGYPNYKVARIPILSGLNVKAWELYLQVYSDKRVLQYIKFGFPLSLIGASELGNKEITNHYSACQYPEEVQKYIVLH